MHRRLPVLADRVLARMLLVGLQSAIISRQTIFSAAAVICSPTAPPATPAVSRRLFSPRFSVLLFHNFFIFGQFGNVVCSLDISGIGTRSARPAYQARQCSTAVLYFFTIHCRPIISTSAGQIFAPNVQGW